MADRNIDKQTGEVYEYSDDDQRMVVYNPQTVELFGMTIPNEWPHAKKIKALADYTATVTAPAKRIDDFLNTIIKVTGCYQHPVEVRNEQGILEPKTRTIIFIAGEPGEEYDKPELVAMTSDAVDKVFKSTIIPLFGTGNWEEPVHMKFRKVPTRRGSTFSIRIFEDYGPMPKGNPTIVNEE